MPIKDISGERFGRLVVQELLDTRAGYARWKCLCDCGAETVALGTHLRSGNTTSCGCAQRDAAYDLKFVHGQRNTPTYWSWQNMIRRCVDQNGKRYHRYGGRGIKVCKRWRESFLDFVADMGDSPGKGYSLERKDPDKNYCKENCEWIPKTENTIETYRGKPTKRALSKKHS